MLYNNVKVLCERDGISVSQLERTLIILVSPLKSYWSVEEEEIDKNV